MEQKARLILSWVDKGLHHTSWPMADLLEELGLGQARGMKISLRSIAGCLVSQVGKLMPQKGNIRVGGASHQCCKSLYLLSSRVDMK